MQSLNTVIGLLSKGGTRNVQCTSAGVGDEELASLILAMENSPAPLEEINLSGNNITSAGARALARFIQKTPTLREVQLQGNKIEDDGARAFIPLFANPTFPKLFDIDENPCSKALVHNVTLLARGGDLSSEIRRALITGETDELDLTGIDNNSLDPRLVPYFVEHIDGLSRLILSGCSLRDAGVGAIGLLVKNSSLRHLDLSKNDVSDVGLLQFIEFANLRDHPTITSLSFAENIRIGNSSAQELSKILFARNEKITFFNLAETSVTSKVIAVVNHECELNKQPPTLKRIVVRLRTNDPSCTSVNLQWEDEMEKAVHFIAPVLQKNSHLLELNLGNCSLGDKGAVILADALRQNGTIRVIAVPNNGITSRGAKAIFQCLQQHTSLTEANLAGNEISDEAALSLLSALQTNSLLKCVNINNNFFSADYMNEVEGLLLINQSPLMIRQLVLEIEADKPSLTTVSLSEGLQGEYCNNASVRILSQALLLNKHITSLDLSKNLVGDIGVGFLSEMLMTNNVIKQLNLAESYISNRGAHRLCDALRTNISIQRLDLSDNAINDHGVEGYPEMLKFNPTVVEISLERTGVSKALYTKIIEAANLNKETRLVKDTVYRLQRGDTTLTKVDLRRELCLQPLDDQSMGTICIHLQGKPFVEYLILGGNTIGAEGCKSIGNLLAQENCGIRLLDLSSNPIDDSGLGELAKAISSKNCALETLILSETRVTSAGINVLTDALKINATMQEVIPPDTVSADAFCAMNRELMVNAQPKSLKPLLASIDANENITNLVFRDPEAPFTDAACQLLCASLINNTHIELLDLSHNNLTGESMPFLAEALFRCPGISSVDLSHNRIDDEGCEYLLRTLRTSDHLISLAIDGNLLSDSYIDEIKQLLYLNAGSVKLKKVLLLHKSGNFTDEMIDLNAQGELYKLTDEDVRILCEVMVESSTLRAVDLGMNNITDVGCEMIADVLSQNHKLEALYLDYNPIGSIGGEALYSALKTNHQLHTLFLEGTDVPEGVWEEILSLLHVNKTPLKERINMRAVRLENIDSQLQFKNTDYALSQEANVAEDALSLYMRPRTTLLLNS